MLLVGACFAVGGLWLAKLGGSLYYVFAGGGCLVAGVLLWRRRRLGLWIYLTTLVATTLWALLEVGLDFWQLVPRLDLFAGLAVPMILPGLRRELRPVVGKAQSRSSVETQAERGSVLALLGVLAVVAIVLGAGLMRSGSASGSKPVSPTALPSALAGVSESIGTDWIANGGDVGGTRFSSAAQITPDNAHKLQVAWSYRTGDVPNASSSPMGANRSATARFRKMHAR